MVLVYGYVDLEDGYYRAWIRAHDQLGFGDWSSSVVFRVGLEEPGEVQQFEYHKSPVDGFESLEWNSTPNAEYYDLWIDSLSAAIPKIQRVSDLSGNGYSLRGLDSGMYRGWIRAGNEAGWGKWSQPLQFQVGDGRLPAPTIQYPALEFSSTTTIDEARRLWIAWSEIRGATSYRIQVDDIGRDQPGVVNQTVTTQSFTPTTWENGDYRVWVQAIGPTGNGSWSVPRDFRVNISLPGRPRIDGTVVDPETGSHQLRWQSAWGVVQHDISIVDVASGEVVVQESGNIAQPYGLPHDLPDGDYQVKLRGYNVIGIGEWSDPLDFGVRTAPTLYPFNAPSSTRRPTIEWTTTSLSRLDEFEIWVSDLSDNWIFLGTTVSGDGGLEGSQKYTSAEDWADGDYRVWVRVLGEHSQSAWSQPIDITVRAAANEINDGLKLDLLFAASTNFLDEVSPPVAEPASAAFPVSTAFPISTASPVPAPSGQEPDDEYAW